MVPINLKEDLLTIIERDFNGLFSGEVGVSSISGGQCRAVAIKYSPVPSLKKFDKLAKDF